MIGMNRFGLRSTLISLTVVAAAVGLALFTGRGPLAQSARLLFAPHREVVLPVAPVEVSKYEELAVYSALLEQAYPETKGKVIVIGDRTNGCAPIEEEPNWERDMLNSMPEVGTALFGDYLLKNSQCSSLIKETELGGKYVVIPDEEVMDVIRNDSAGWGGFYRKYPDSIGFITLSRIGFNSEVSQALVYTGLYQGVRQAKGMRVLLSKRDGGWAVLRKYGAWSY